MSFFKPIAAAATLAASVRAADLQTIPFKDMDGKDHTLAEYKGKVVLIVNVASKCGLTRQYKALEETYRKYKDRGFVVIGFPCNDFAGQEPGDKTEIRAFCTTQYDVTFPLMDKLHVKDAEQHALYVALTGKNGVFPGDVKWNFGKFLVSREGKATARFEPRTTPDSPEVISAIEKALGE
jgi:glutathione peroxidase